MRKISVISKAKDKSNTIQERRMDIGMLAVIMILLCMGIVMVSSASSYYALSTYSNSNYFLSKQLILAIAGVIAMLIISKIDYRKYKKYSYLFYIISFLLLGAVLFIGQEKKGATRWLGFGSFSFQPSEIMKIAIVFAISYYLSRNVKKLTSLKGYIIPFIFLLLVMVIMYFQNHLSGTLVMIIATVSIIFASGIKLNLKLIATIVLIGRSSSFVFHFI